MIQARIAVVHFLHDWRHPKPEKQAEYERLQARFPDGIKQLNLEDLEADWAVSGLRDKGSDPVDETGHQS
jgi:dCMP deaminase